jgi:hypothetical protein
VYQKVIDISSYGTNSMQKYSWYKNPYRMSKYSMPGNLNWWFLLGYRSASLDADHKLSVVNDKT